MVKLAVTLLSKRALTWQRAESIKPWAILGVLDWQTFAVQILTAFRNHYYEMKRRNSLYLMSQTGSVQAYSQVFRGVYLEIRHVMAESDALFLYVRGLKAQVQAQVMMQNPSTIEDAMRIADSADSVIWFANKMTQRLPNPNPRPNPARLPRPPPPQQPAWPVPIELGAIKANHSLNKSNGYL